MYKQLVRLFSFVSLFFIGFIFPLQAEEPIPEDYRYYLMIGDPNSRAWGAVIQAEGDMAVPAKKVIETMGGRLIGYYLAVGSAKNYGVVAFPNSKAISQIVYMREMQGLMDSIEFIEVKPTDKMIDVFKEINKMAKSKGG